MEEDRVGWRRIEEDIYIERDVSLPIVHATLLC
jgi:hypothetical protein